MTIKQLATVFLFFVGIAGWCAGQGYGSLKITVTDTSGASIPGAHVHVVNQREISVMTDQHGKVSVDDLPPGKYDVSARSKGFLEEELSGIAVASGATKEVLFKLAQAPPSLSEIRVYKTLNSSSFVKLLDAFNEQDLCKKGTGGNGQSYLFLWKPTFGHPVFMRIDIGHDGTGTLHTKILSGAGGYEWGKVATSTTRKLSFQEEAKLFTTIADIGFWSLPARVKDPYNTVVDGTTWVIEGLRDGDCHAIERYSSPLTEIFSRSFLGQVGKVGPYYRNLGQTGRFHDGRR